jgi:(5-formylfuran-3-yl)methyl phosphate synthase
MRLLVSVRGSVEARAAVAGGADVIDAKDPDRGPLGTVRADQLAAIRREVGAARLVSAALGDARDDAAVAAAAAAASGLAFVKLGFGGVTSEARARRLARAARRGAPPATAVVLVAYADWRRADSLAPARLPTVAAETGAAGLLLDTAWKDLSLFALEAPEAVAAWVAAVRAVGLFAALAGSLSGGDFATARAVGADLVGVRGAACEGGRGGRVSQARVAALQRAVRTASPPTLALDALP